MWKSQETGNCLISAGLNWPQLQSNRLFVQMSYSALWRECQKNFDVGVQGIFLLGTPGVGKSCFLDYCLHRCVQDDKSVLYFLGPSRKALVFQIGGAVEEHKLEDALDRNMADKADVVLFDPHESTVQQNNIHISHFRGKPFIVAISPDRENCKKLRKDTRRKARLYMGTLSVDEAEAMRSTCYPEVPSGLLRTRYASFGGIARHLFEPLLADQVDGATREVEQNQVSALYDIAENPRRIDGGEVTSQFKHLWSLYHLEPTITGDGLTDYTTYTIELCCDDARTRVRDMLLNRTVLELWELFVNTMEKHGTLRGIRYEAYAHKKILAEGLSATAVSLTNEGIGRRTIPVEIPASLPKISMVHSDLGASFNAAIARARKEQNGGYLLPSLSNFPVVDSLFVPSNEQHHTLLFQMKAGRSKPLSGAAATTIYNTTAGHLIFVVPDESILARKFGYSGSSGGPINMRQYRLVIKE